MQHPLHPCTQLCFARNVLSTASLSLRFSWLLVAIQCVLAHWPVLVAHFCHLVMVLFVLRCVVPHPWQIEAQGGPPPGYVIQHRKGVYVKGILNGEEKEKGTGSDSKIVNIKEVLGGWALVWCWSAHLAGGFHAVARCPRIVTSGAFVRCILCGLGLPSPLLPPPPPHLSLLPI